MAHTTFTSPVTASRAGRINMNFIDSSMALDQNITAGDRANTSGGCYATFMSSPE